MKALFQHCVPTSNADELLGIFVDSFTEESYAVQLQTLKLFLKKPDSSQGVVQRVLNTATKDCDSPDVRDRAYIYWRLLSTDPGAAKAVVQPIVLLYLCLGQQCHLLCWRKFQVWQVFTTSLQRHSSVVAEGARTLQRKGAELTDDRLSAQKTLQTIITNQQTKNLINFKISGTEGQPSGLAATEVLSSTPAAANLLAGPPAIRCAVH